MRTWGPRALRVAATTPVSLAASLVASPFIRRFRPAAGPRPRSPDLFGDVVHWGRQNPELVAGIALSVGALLGPGRMRLVKAGLALLPRVVPALTAAAKSG